MKTNNKPIFVSIETTAFSGATLLALLLGSHSLVVTVGEITGLLAHNDPNEYRCSCGQIINQCTFWQAVGTAMAEKGYPFGLGNFNTRYRFEGPAWKQRLVEGSARIAWVDALRDQVLYAIPSQKRQVQVITKRNVALISAILEVAGVHILVDSAKDRIRPYALRRFSYLDTRIIHLVRRVEGVVASQLRRGRSADVGRLAYDWLRRHQRLEVVRQNWPRNKILRVRYEDICQEPQATMARLFRFLDVEPPASGLDFQARQHVIGNPMRLRKLVEIKLDERWRQELTIKQRQAINAVAGELMQQYGYTA